jgi:hypothetical protein
MPDPAKDLEIKLRATGGDAAAKEVEKLEEALEGVAEASEHAAATTTGAGGEVDYSGKGNDGTNSGSTFSTDGPLD